MNSAQQVAIEPEHEVETDKATIEAELNRLLGEKRFAGAPQLSRFLRYVVTETLEGRGDRIKAYTVGVDALGKPYTFDAQNDPSVRVLALRLRKTLVAMYDSDQIRHAVVSFKVGNYTPEFYRAINRVDQPLRNGTVLRSAEPSRSIEPSKSAEPRDDQSGPFFTSGTKTSGANIGADDGMFDAAAVGNSKPAADHNAREQTLSNRMPRF